MKDCYPLSIPVEFGGQRQYVTPVLLRDDKELILVDCGYPGQVDEIEEAARQAGLSLGSATRLIVTHHDMDHMGSLAELKRLYPGIEIIAHEDEKRYIEGKERSLRLVQAEETLASLTDEAKAAAEQFIAFLRGIQSAPVDATVAGGDRLPWCGGIEIVHTPGHMPGHISLYLPVSKTMIAADAVVIEAGKLAIANPRHTLDLPEAVRSIRRLLDYEIDRLVCYHGGVYQGDAREGLQELVQAYAC